MYLFFIMHNTRMVAALKREIKKAKEVYDKHLKTLYNEYGADLISVPVMTIREGPKYPIFSYKKRLDDITAQHHRLVPIIPLIYNREFHDMSYFNYTILPKTLMEDLPSDVQTALKALSKVKSDKQLILEGVKFSSITCRSRNGTNEVINIFPQIHIDKTGDILLIFNIKSNLYKIISKNIMKGFNPISYEDLKNRLGGFVMDKFGVMNLYVCPKCSLCVEEEEVSRLGKCPECGAPMEMTKEQHKENDDDNRRS